MKIIVDSDEAIVGRLGSFAAKELLKGNEVVVINSENAIISGDKNVITEKIVRWRAKGLASQKGPKVSKLHDRLLKRMIRGMLPWDKPKGRNAFKKLKCFVGNGNLKNEELGKVKKLGHKKPFKYIKIKDIVRRLG